MESPLPLDDSWREQPESIDSNLCCQDSSAFSPPLLVPLYIVQSSLEEESEDHLVELMARTDTFQVVFAQSVFGVNFEQSTELVRE